ncbi:hypothetical protein NDI85_21300 [Halomicroarcula sp. S1AR25-4]|uniref:hypothetical protein n=1 Tax=Haloarcula sp. S1AR25-4 TaxID=2950538 RepID=UPI002874220E|nr:hypothetical protein [Halomicroarcula sp. S1AR25-4]MDS0280325.1 hypothetical protein [Halomicroarcula sp. S1AR25-4]
MSKLSKRSFADPDTLFELVRSDTPVDVDGYKLGEPTGKIKCDECGAVAKNIDEIPHTQGCSQRFVLSVWFVEQVTDR